MSGCGGTAKAATGAPISLGGIYTDVPGLDLTPIARSVQAYFDCVNAHGGIDGRPIKYTVETEALNPQQAAEAATKLLSQDHVLGMVGNTSVLDCPVNGKTYAKAGINVIGAATNPVCFALPTFASATLGPIYAAQLGAQYLASRGDTKLVALTTETTGWQALNSGILALGKAKNLPVASVPVPVPVTNPNGTALSAVNQAGAKGGVIMDFTGATQVALLNSIASQGLTGRAQWMCVTTCNASALIKGLSPAWNGKLVVSNDYPLINSSGPDATLYRAVAAKYDASDGTSVFGQLGFTMAKIYADTLRTLPAAQLTRTAVNRAIGAIKNYKTDMLCQPFTFGTGAGHIPVSSGRIDTVKNGQFVQLQGCTSLSPVTPALKAAEAQSS